MTLALSAATLDATFPWHVVFDESLRVWSAGRVLRRLIPDIVEKPLDAIFTSLRPTEELRAESFRERPTLARLLQAKDKPLLVLCGQIVPTADGRFLFVGGPRADLEGLQALGISLADFAPQDAIADWLFLAQAQRASLADATRFSGELSAMNEKLEQLVAERTRELTQEKTERERVESELRLAQRLEAVGQLASGVAHEINTPIQYVMNSVQFLDEGFRDLIGLDPLFLQAVESLRGGTPELANRLEGARAAADAEYLVEQVPKAFQRTFEGLNQVAEIVRAMKAFAHPGIDSKAPADINAAIKNTLAVTKNEYKYVADVEIDLADIPWVPCNLGQLNQVFLNLIVNAAHAIGDKVAGTTERGHIRVRTSSDAESVTIEIADDGKGIPTAIRDRIFDPFFTTKPVGQGTGQGLTIARSIVVQHRGKLDLESVEGEGTTFTITLPLESTEGLVCLD